MRDAELGPLALMLGLVGFTLLASSDPFTSALHRLFSFLGDKLSQGQREVMRRLASRFRDELSRSPEMRRLLASLFKDKLSMLLLLGGVGVGVGVALVVAPMTGLVVVIVTPAAVMVFNQIRELLSRVGRGLELPQVVGSGASRLLARLLPGKGLRRALGDLVRRVAAPWAVVGKRIRQLAGAGMMAAAIGLGISALLGGDADDVERESKAGAASGRGGAAVEVDPGWLEGLARAWFTYEGEEKWLAGLEPYLVPGATDVLRECLSQLRFAWRLARTTIVEGPWVEVQGRLSQLRYGISDPGGAVGQPEIKERYGIELGPDDVGVRLSAVVARELPPEKARLPGTDIITRPQRASVQFFIVGGRAVPDARECGRGVAFVG